MAPFQIRRAQSGDEPQIVRLLVAAGWQLDDLDLDWASSLPHWLVAANQAVVGCLQVALGKPVGYLELLAVDRQLPKETQALAVKGLCLAGAETLHQYGAQLAAGMIAFQDKGWKKVLLKRGGVTIGAGNRLVFKL